MNDWEETLREERTARDESSAEHPRSPIPAADRDGFDRLEYYPPDPAYRFEVELDRSEDPDELTVETTQDGEQTYLRWGQFYVDLDGTGYTLTAYEGQTDEATLWVPIRDETNGEETHPAGRYLDLDEDDRTTDGTWVLDFHRAYSPFRAFSDAYECPLVPLENWLDVAIEAGEKTPE